MAKGSKESKLKFLLKSTFFVFKNLGVDLIKLLSIKNYKKILKNYLRFNNEKKEWIKQGGHINKLQMQITEYEEEAGFAKGMYFHTDLLVARKIYKHNPKRHLDIGSRTDGFVAHIASFREIEVVDIRQMPKSEHKNIKFIQADLQKPQRLGKTDSLSCLSVIEHFGLGRYSDEIDLNGDVRGLENIINLVNKGGRIYISIPISYEDEVHFNAHRLYSPLTILNFDIIKKNLNLIEFNCVDDEGRLHVNVDLNNINQSINFGCGIYIFEKVI